MYKKSTVFVSKPHTYFEKREIDGKTRYLVLWSDMPMWMVVDDELFLLLGMFNGVNTIGMITEKLSSALNQDQSVTKRQLNKVVPLLTDNKTLYRRGDKPPASDMGEKKIREVIIHPTNRCNLHCIHCCNRHNWVPKEAEISTESIKQFLDQIREFTCENPSLSIIGGEPLLETEKALDIAKYAKRIGFSQIGISTNGILITKEFAKESKKLGMEVQVSIDGTTMAENDKIRGKGTFKKILNAIRLLKEEGAFVITNFTITGDTFNSLDAYFKMVLELGVDSARFGPMKRIGAGLNKELKTVPVDELLSESHKLFVKHPEYRKLLGKDYFSAFANSCRLRVRFDYCGTGLLTVLLNSDGNIYPCTGHALPEFKVGNIKETSFSKLWKESPILKKIRTTYPVDRINDKCSNCIVRYWCMGGCRAEAYHVTGKMDSPAVECENIKKAVIEMIWLLSTAPEIGRGTVYKFD